MIYQAIITDCKLVCYFIYTVSGAVSGLLVYHPVSEIVHAQEVGTNPLFPNSTAPLTGNQSSTVTFMP